MKCFLWKLKLFCDKFVVIIISYNVVLMKIIKLDQSSLKHNNNSIPSMSVSIWVNTMSDLAFSSKETTQGFVSLTSRGKAAPPVCPPPNGPVIDECLTLKGSKLGGSWSGIVLPSLALLISWSAFCKKKAYFFMPDWKIWTN